MTGAEAIPVSKESNFSTTSQSRTQSPRSHVRRGQRLPNSPLPGCSRKGKNVVPIPGTSSVERLDENVHSLDLILTSDDLDRLERAAPKGAVSGDRYEPGMMQLING